MSWDYKGDRSGDLVERFAFLADWSLVIRYRSVVIVLGMWQRWLVNNSQKLFKLPKFFLCKRKMSFKPRSRVPTLPVTPFNQTLELATSSGGEVRGSGRPFAGIWGRRPQGLLARNKLFSKAGFVYLRQGDLGQWSR